MLRCEVVDTNSPQSSSFSKKISAIELGHTQIVGKGRLWVRLIVLKNVIYL